MGSHGKIWNLLLDEPASLEEVQRVGSRPVILHETLIELDQIDLVKSGKDLEGGVAEPQENECETP